MAQTRRDRLAPIADWSIDQSRTHKQAYVLQASAPTWVVASRRYAPLLSEALRLAGLTLRGVLWIDDVGTAAAARRQSQPQSIHAAAAAAAEGVPAMEAHRFEAVAAAPAPAAAAVSVEPPEVEASAG